MARGRATKSDRCQLSFRSTKSKKAMLQAFMHEDGHTDLSPVLRDAIDYYLAERLRGGKDAVKLD
jgi:hypothetical protein